jgi:hypothetical protein
LTGGPKSIKLGLDDAVEIRETVSMKKKRRLRTWEELLDLEDKYFPGSLGNLVSLGAAHFRQTS